MACFDFFSKQAFFVPSSSMPPAARPPRAAGVHFFEKLAEERAAGSGCGLVFIAGSAA